VFAPAEDKSNDWRASFYEELQHVFDHLPTDHTKNLCLENLMLYWGENIFTN